MSRHVRIGLIVPSSNTTMETEIPAMLRRRAELDPETTFTFHSSRVRLKHVTREELAQMVSDSDRAAIELADARVDVIGYACLVALMAEGPGYFEQAEETLARVAAEHGASAPVVSSAGALVRSLETIGARKIAVVAPYMEPITEQVVECIVGAGVEVVDHISLEVPDNLEVGRLDPSRLPEIAAGLDTSKADAIVLSACVQMPSLAAIPEAERRFDLPVVTAATATTYEMLTRLGLDPTVPDAGYLLSGRLPALAG
jgi:maleate isomerase